VAVTGEQPRVLTIQDSEALPAGPFESGHRMLQIGLRSWVERQTHHPLGYIEQLYTFADRDRMRDGTGERLVSISYLGLTREGHASGERAPRWQLVPSFALGGLALRPAHARRAGHCTVSARMGQQRRPFCDAQASHFRPGLPEQ
jgi:hypothetical protein